MRKKTLILSFTIVIFLFGILSAVCFSTEYSSKSGLYNCDEQFDGKTYVGQYDYKEKTYQLPFSRSITVTTFYDAQGNRIDEPDMVPGCEKIW